MDTHDRDSLLLLQLVALFQSTALQQMGKLKNPVTDTIERNLDQARISIDMIEMLKTKMKGNLSPDEDRTISAVLRDLRLNFVDESGKTDPSPAEGKEEGHS
ncbi:MAG TPA: DUF1844 domain-containing protein [Bacteroidota bacterium]|nr:DUF1844 domain-containing protein [Bacteroidota bacterium]